MFETETEIADRGKVKGGARVPAKRQGEKNFGMTARICGPAFLCFGRKAVGTYTQEKEPLKGPLRWPPGTSVLGKIKLEVTLAPTRGALPRCSFFLWGRAHKALARGTRPPENRSGRSWTEGACRGCARSVA